MFAIIGVSLFSYELIKIMVGSKEFWGAVVIVPILAISIFFTNLKDFSIYGLTLCQKNECYRNNRHCLNYPWPCFQPHFYPIMGNHRGCNCNPTRAADLLVCMLLLLSKSLLYSSSAK